MRLPLGKLCYFIFVRQTQWDMPSFDDTEPESLSGELETPSDIVEEHHKKVYNSLSHRPV